MALSNVFIDFLITQLVQLSVSLVFSPTHQLMSIYYYYRVEYLPFIPLSGIMQVHSDEMEDEKLLYPCNDVLTIKG